MRGVGDYPLGSLGFCSLFYLIPLLRLIHCSLKNILSVLVKYTFDISLKSRR